MRTNNPIFVAALLALMPSCLANEVNTEDRTVVVELRGELVECVSHIILEATDELARKTAEPVEVRAVDADTCTPVELPEIGKQLQERFPKQNTVAYALDSACADEDGSTCSTSGTFTVSNGNYTYTPGTSQAECRGTCVNGDKCKFTNHTAIPGPCFCKNEA